VQQQQLRQAWARTEAARRLVAALAWACVRAGLRHTSQRLLGLCQESEHASALFGTSGGRHWLATMPGQATALQAAAVASGSEGMVRDVLWWLSSVGCLVQDQQSAASHEPPTTVINASDRPLAQSVAKAPGTGLPSLPAAVACDANSSKQWLLRAWLSGFTHPELEAAYASQLAAGATMYVGGHITGTTLVWAANALPTVQLVPPDLDLLLLLVLVVPLVALCGRVWYLGWSRRSQVHLEAAYMLWFVPCALVGLLQAGSIITLQPDTSRILGTKISDCAFSLAALAMAAGLMVGLLPMRLPAQMVTTLVHMAAVAAWLCVVGHPAWWSAGRAIAHGVCMVAPSMLLEYIRRRRFIRRLQQKHVQKQPKQGVR